HAGDHRRRALRVRRAGADPADPRGAERASNEPAPRGSAGRRAPRRPGARADMTMEPRPPISGYRIAVLLGVLVNLILTIALITQVREVQQRLAGVPADLASKRDVASLRPLPIRQVLMKNCVECHTTRRLGRTVSMEPAEIQRTVERMQTHPGA